MQSPESGRRLVELFQKSLVNCGLTRGEYEEILALSAGGGIEDPTDQLLLKQLNQFMANAVIRSGEE